MANIWDKYEDVSVSFRNNKSVTSPENTGSIWDKYEDVSSQFGRTPQSNVIVQPNEQGSTSFWSTLPDDSPFLQARNRELERQQSLPEDASTWDRIKSYVGLPVTDEDYERRNARAYSASQVPTLGFGDELYGAAKAISNGLLGNEGVVESYKKARDEARDFSSRAKEQYPEDYSLGSTIGAVGTTAATVPLSIPSALTGITGSTALGALTGYGTSDSDTLKGQAIDTAIGAGLGAAGGIAGKVIGEGVELIGNSAKSIANRLRNGKDPLSTEEGLRQAISQVRERANQAYIDADNAGVVLKPEFTTNLHNSIESTLSESGYTPRLQPGIKSVLAEIKDISDKDVSLKQIDNIRKIVGSVSIDGSPSERRLAGKITNIIDKKIGNVSANELSSGNINVAVDAIKKARKDWKTQAKLSTVADLLDKAERRASVAGTGGNAQNTLRQNLNRILNTKEGRGWSEAEKEAIRNVVFGTPSQNRLRLIGRLSPETGAIGITGLGAAGAASQLTGNPLYLVPSAIGYGSKRASEAISDRNALDVLRTILNGGNTTNQGLIPPDISNRLIEYLSRGGALGLSSRSNDF